MKMRISSQKAKINTSEERFMIVMNIKIDNFFAFKNFEMNMSYPKKIVNSSIEGEFLKGRENFRFKKVNILMGANATGKTSVGKMLMSIFNAINKKEYTRLLDLVTDEEKMASFSIDFVSRSYKLYRLEMNIMPFVKNEESPKMKVNTRFVDINNRDSYESCVKRLEQIPYDSNSNFVEQLEKVERLGWMFSYPADTAGGVVKCSRNANYLTILNYTLRALDPSIKQVEQLNEIDNAYVIRMDTQDLIIQDGEVIKNSILSSGTKAGMDIANMLSSICAGECGFYYCDEMFSYVHSDIEKAFLTVMINNLHDNEQLFFTTHNSDILDMQLPRHTFVFLKKDTSDIQQPVKCFDASKYLKRNTDSLRNAVENDLFSIAPNLEHIYEISEINKSY